MTSNPGPCLYAVHPSRPSPLNHSPSLAKLRNLSSNMSTKLTIEQMQALARKHRGKCFSKRYVNNRTKLRWQCAKGHE